MGVFDVMAGWVGYSTERRRPRRRAKPVARVRQKRRKPVSKDARETKIALAELNEAIALGLVGAPVPFLALVKKSAKKAPAKKVRVKKIPVKATPVKAEFIEKPKEAEAFQVSALSKKDPECMYWAPVAWRDLSKLPQPKEWRGYVNGVWCTTVHLSRRGHFTSTACVGGVVLTSSTGRTLESAQQAAQDLFLGPLVGICALIKWARIAWPGVVAVTRLNDGIKAPTARQQALGVTTPEIRLTPEEDRIATRVLVAAGAISQPPEGHQAAIQKAQQVAAIEAGKAKTAEVEAFHVTFNRKHQAG